MIVSICRKLSRGWNNFELMVAGGGEKKVLALAQLFQPLASCNPLLSMWIFL